MKECGTVIRLFYEKVTNSLYQTKPRTFVQRDCLRMELEQLAEKIRKRYPKTKPLTQDQWYIAHTMDEEVIRYRHLFKEYWMVGEDSNPPQVQSCFVCQRCEELYNNRLSTNLPSLYSETLHVVFIRGKSFFNKLQDANIVARIYCPDHVNNEISLIELILSEDWEEIEEFWVEIHSQDSLFQRLVNMGFTIIN